MLREVIPYTYSDPSSQKKQQAILLKFTKQSEETGAVFLSMSYAVFLRGRVLVGDVTMRCIRVTATRLRSSSTNRQKTVNVPRTACQSSRLAAASNGRGISTVRTSPLPTYCIAFFVTPKFLHTIHPLYLRIASSYPFHHIHTLITDNPSDLATSVSRPLPYPPTIRSCYMIFAPLV